MAEQVRIIADRGGVAVAEQGPLVLVVDRGTGPVAALAFVLGVSTLVVGGFGTVALLAGSLPRTLGMAFLAAGLVLATLTYLAVGAIRRRRRRPLTEYRPVAVLDRRLGTFSYPGDPVLPLNQTRFERRLQIGSSSPKLVAVTPAGTRVLKHGNPFDGGIGRIDQMLNTVAHGGY